LKGPLPLSTIRKLAKRHSAVYLKLAWYVLASAAGIEPGVADAIPALLKVASKCSEVRYRAQNVDKTVCGDTGWEVRVLDLLYHQSKDLTRRQMKDLLIFVALFSGK
jgi:hypothetical protein